MCAAGVHQHIETLIVVIVLWVAGGVVGAVTTRAWAPVVAAAALVIYYLGLESGWWGDGTGDGWQVAMALTTLVAIAVSYAGVLVGRRRS